MSVDAHLAQHRRDVGNAELEAYFTSVIRSASDGTPTLPPMVSSRVRTTTVPVDRR